MADAQTRRQEYEAEKAALDAVNAPASAYARLDQAFFGTTAPAPAGLVAWATRHLLIVLPVLVAGAGLLSFLVIEGPYLINRGINGWTIGEGEAAKARALTDRPFSGLNVPHTEPYYITLRREAFEKTGGSDGQPCDSSKPPLSELPTSPNRPPLKPGELPACLTKFTP